MNIKQISVEFGATIPTGSYANVKIAATWVVDLEPDDVAELATSEIYRRIKETLEAAYVANASDPIEESKSPQSSVPPPANPPPPLNTPSSEEVNRASGVGITKMNVNGKVHYEIACLFGTEEQNKPIKGKPNVDKLETALQMAGLSPLQWPAGKRFMLDIDFTWTKGDPTPQGGRFNVYQSFNVKAPVKP